VHLVEVAEHVVRGEVGQQPPPVLGLRRVVVGAGDRQVQLVVRRRTDPAEPVGEGQVGGAV
jgi:hypothetical protein